MNNKKLIGLVIILAAAVGVAACAKKEAPAENTAAETAAATETKSQTEPEAETEAKASAETEAEPETVGMANPMVEITDSAEFEKQLGIKIDAGKLHTEPKMFIIDGKTADVIMEETNVDGEPVEYRLRATKDASLAPMMHGIYGDLVDIGKVDMDFKDNNVTIVQRETSDGKTTIHTWQVGDVYYSLTIDNTHSQMQYAEIMDSIFLAIGIDPSASSN